MISRLQPGFDERYTRVSSTRRKPFICYHAKSKRWRLYTKQTRNNDHMSCKQFDSIVKHAIHVSADYERAEVRNIKWPNTRQ